MLFNVLKTAISMVASFFTTVLYAKLTKHPGRTILNSCCTYINQYYINNQLN